MSEGTLEQIEREELLGLFGRMLVVRLAFVPLVASAVLYLVWREGMTWRVWALLAVLAGAGSFFLRELARYRKTGFRSGALEANVFAMALVHSCIVVVSGGIRSPFCAAVVPISIMNGLFLRGPLSHVLTVAQFVMLWTAAAYDWTAEGAAYATVLSLILMIARFVSATIRSTLDVILRRAVVAQDATLNVYSERNSELTALSGELAHELKNPLASIKGLAGLIDEQLAGKAHERMAVLRGEVERMQGILEEFLNFSRPLVPLAKTRASLRAIAEDVLRLHEGMARERGLSVALAGDDVTVECDARKVKQILVNLVQNAIEASPADSVVEIDVGRPLSVHDRGPGVTSTRVFEAGVTTKATGSGLGLTIARALARQHGGELTLEPRAGGGTSAKVMLP